MIGDGSMTGGMAFEGLNNLGHSGRRVIIVLNDNGRSYAPTVSLLSESLIRLRLDPRVAPRTGEGRSGRHPVAGRRGVGAGLGGHQGCSARDVGTPGVLRGSGGALHRAGRRSRSGRPGAGAAQRRRVRGRADHAARAHREGSGPPCGGERPDQEAPRSQRVQGRFLHRGVLRGADQGGREPARGRGDHRRHARLDGAVALRGALPGPVSRRRHRRTARAHRRGGYDHGRAAAGGRAVLDLSDPGGRPAHL